jgi:CheY-like chemotaxis protein
MARILYVDDEQALVFLMTRMLKVLGHEAAGYTSPHDALAAFRNDPRYFDLTLTDLSMVGMSGLELAEQLLTIRADAPVAIATGHVLEEDVKSARRLGVLDVITKPGSLDELEKALTPLLEKSRLASQTGGR